MRNLDPNALPVATGPNVAEALQSLSEAAPERAFGRWNCSGMEPTIKAGDVIEIDVSVKAFGRDGIYLIDIGGTPALRRISFMFNKPGSVRLSQDVCPHAAYEERKADVKVIGQVRRSWSPRGL